MIQFTKLFQRTQLHRCITSPTTTITLPNKSQFSTGRRVVVTGLGVVSPLGIGASHAFKNLNEGKCGVVKYDASLSTGQDPWKSCVGGDTDDKGSLNIPSKVAALVPLLGSNPFGVEVFNPRDWVSKEDERSQSAFIQFAMSAAKQALADAEWIDISDFEKEQTGVCFGSGIGSLLDTVSTWESLNKRGYSRVSPFYVPRILTNMAAGHISMAFGFQGPNHSVSTACSTGAHSLGDAMRFIQFGDADVMVAGGSEASVHALSLGGFSRARSLSTRFNDSPQEASRPFDKDRDGFVIGEGAGAVVLEELEHARKRGARIYAEMKGYGLSGDAHHMTSPPDSGRGAKRAMTRALETANLSPSNIGYINAHATSTEKGDAIENRAIRELFSGNNELAVSSSKGSIGHLLGAAGAVEAVFTILALHEGVFPPTRNLHNLSGDSNEFPFNYVPRVGQPAKNLTAALSNSFGFGGTNASLCFSKYD